MTRKEYTYDVHAEVDMTKQEIAILLQCCERHYDGTCKAAGKPGGRFHGWKNMIDLGVPLIVRGRELDLALKALEQGELFNPPIEGWFQLRQSMYNIMKDMNAEYCRINGLTR